MRGRTREIERERKGGTEREGEEREKGCTCTSISGLRGASRAKSAGPWSARTCRSQPAAPCTHPGIPRERHVPCPPLPGTSPYKCPSHRFPLRHPPNHTSTARSRQAEPTRHTKGIHPDPDPAAWGGSKRLKDTPPPKFRSRSGCPTGDDKWW
jgi:hypothetical protein